MTLHDFALRGTIIHVSVTSKNMHMSRSMNRTVGRMGNNCARRLYHSTNTGICTCFVNRKFDYQLACRTGHVLLSTTGGEGERYADRMSMFNLGRENTTLNMESSQNHGIKLNYGMVFRTLYIII